MKEISTGLKRVKCAQDPEMELEIKAKHARNARLQLGVNARVHHSCFNRLWTGCT
jgi:hypothetical protein